MKHMQRVGTAMFLAGAAALVTACSEPPASPTSPAEAVFASAPPQGGPVGSTPAPRPSEENFEIRFMTTMIDHHMMAIEMAEICLEKAVHDELRETCEDIIATQRQEISTMQAWLRDWYGISYEPTMKPGDEKMLERLASLSGAEFEIAFMEMMIKHHEKAIKASRHCLDKAWHTELREMCEDIIATQAAEIAQFEAWLCQWYDRCR